MQGNVVFITGSSGFIGSNLAKRILTTEPDTKVIGLDNMNDYYDVRIKEARLAELQKFENYTFIKGNLADKALINSIFEQYHPDVVVNLGAQAGVRYSITNPDAYIESNMIGFYNILEACRHYPVEHLVYASSSSVYGSNKKVPYSTDDKVDNPVSLYAATKKSNELMAHAYSKLYNIPSTGLRFFTVYGPAGRPDMAYFGFTNKLVNGETIKIFNYGNCKRDFTYVDDIVEGVVRVMAKAPEKKNGEDGLPIPPYAVYNIGNSNPENLLDFVQILSEELVRAGVLPADYDFEAHKELVPMQPGDVPVTFADTEPLERDFGFKPHTPLRDGLRKFAEWYKSLYGLRERRERMRCEERFYEIYGKDPVGISFCPYRICPIGAHSDHNLGKITGLAIDKGIHIAYKPKMNGVVEMCSLQFPKRAQCTSVKLGKRRVTGQIICEVQPGL